MRRALLLLLIFTALSPMALAQETTEEDPFSDYSYLWENAKKDKKKKKKSKKSETPAPEPSPTDSLSQLPADSLQVEPTQAATDSLTLDPAVSSADLDSLNQAQALQDSLNRAEKEAKRAERAEKNKDKAPNEDFRAGMPALNASSAINGGFTYTIIDGQAYAGLVLSPEISLGKVGIGIDAPILYGLDSKKIRTEIFKDGVGALRLIRYVRVGQQKVDPVYVKVGTFSSIMIGYGGLINNYSNGTSYEKRKIGLHYDINYKGIAGIEGLYSDFNPASFNLFAIRPYVRPLSPTYIPIIETLEIGATFLSDKDQTDLVGTETGSTKYAFTKDGVGAFNIDAGITLLRVPFIQIDLFANYSKLNVSTQALQDSISALRTANLLTTPTSEFTNGTGLSFGFNFRFHFIADVLSTDLRIERLSYSDYFLPQFFDTSYEISKDLKLLSLATAGQTSGIYGSLTGHVLKKLIIGGSLMIPDHIGDTAPAVVSVNADVDRLFDKYSVHAKYFKGGLTDLSDAFKLDERSSARVRFIYHLNKFLMMGVDYYYTFTPTENGFKTTEYVSPYFGVSIQL